jgi:hypothetical protein
MFKRQVLVGMLVALLATTASAVMDFEGYASDAEWKAAGMDGWVMDPVRTHTSFVELRVDHDVDHTNVMRFVRGSVLEGDEIAVSNDLSANLATAPVGGSLSYDVYETDEGYSEAYEIFLYSGGAQVAYLWANVRDNVINAYYPGGNVSGTYGQFAWKNMRFEFAANGYNLYADDADVFGTRVPYDVDASAGIDLIKFQQKDLGWGINAYFDNFYVPPPPPPPAGTVIAIR